MSRYIDADDLKERIPKDIHEDVFENCSNCELLDDEQVKELIDLQPTADVRENVRAHWIDMKPTGDDRFMCSRCKWKEKVPTIMGEPIVWDYCPSCGAQMIGDNDV